MNKRLNSIARPTGLALACAIAIGLAGQAACAQEVKVDSQGTTVRVGPDNGAGAEGADVQVRAPGAAVDVQVQRPGRRIESGNREGGAVVAGEEIEIQAGPSYWVGILGGDVSPELRAHLGLKEEGVIVREVVPKSPAEEGGLKQHDILLRANGRPITSMAVLVEEVRDVGPSKGQVTIDLIRSGDRKTVWIKPTERPAPQPGAAPALGQPGFREVVPGNPRRGGRFGGLFGDRGEPLRLRVFGPGGMLERGNVQVQAPGGTSVQVHSQNGKTQVKVQKGDETWDIDASDPKALEQLPPDVRVLVEGVLGGGGQGVDINIDELMPDLGGLFDRRFIGGNDRLRDLDREMDEMRRQIQALQRQLQGAADPENDQAPAFRPDQVGPVDRTPVEVEIPLEDK